MDTIKKILGLLGKIGIFLVTWFVTLLMVAICAPESADGTLSTTGTLSILIIPLVAASISISPKLWTLLKDCRNKRANRTTTETVPKIVPPRTLVDQHSSSSIPTTPPTTLPQPTEVYPCFSDTQALELLRQSCSTPTSSHHPATDIRDSFAKYGGIDAEMLTVDLMEGHDFEYWCANALRDLGFKDVEVTPGSGDQGVDILATKDDLRYAIQCKRYISDLGNSPVQEVHAGKYIYHCHVAAVITNRYFTAGAIKLASATGVLLWDRDWVLRYLQTKQDPNGSVLISHAPSNPPSVDAEFDDDEMLPAAVDAILDTGQASVSMLQRRLNLGYARCARLMDEMEKLGIVGPFQGSKPRVIYITKEQWEAIKSRGASSSADDVLTIGPRMKNTDPYISIEEKLADATLISKSTEKATVQMLGQIKE